MKTIAKLFAMLCLTFTAFTTLNANSETKEARPICMNTDFSSNVLASYAIKDLDIVTLQIINKKVYRRGCCSWHGGVCGCSLGRTLCCDGTLSPSCTCD